jgi:molybdopterin molybdotransferase
VRPTLSWEEARSKVVTSVAPLPPTDAAVRDALGLAVAETVRSPEAMPPFDNSAVDGFALRAADVAGATAEHPVTLRVLGRRPAGPGFDFRVEPGTAVRVMTGAPVPAGADAVVMIETTSAWDPVRGASRPEAAEAPEVAVGHAPSPGDNVRPRGESVAAGDPMLEPGHVIGAAEVGLLLAVGVVRVRVHPRPRVGVLSTGDELVPAEATPGPGEIRDSNRPALLAALVAEGFPAIDLGLAPDDEPGLTAAVAAGARRVDFLLTSGGVSVGDKDLTRRVLGSLGEVEAYRVAVKPGMPQVFGRLGKTPVFGLPGNPVSSLVVFEEFVLPALRRMAGRAELLPPLFEARLTAPVTRKPGRVEFLRVRLGTDGGRWTASPTGPQGSGILSSMTKADGYAILSAEAERLEAGDTVLCRFRPRS